MPTATPSRKTDPDPSRSSWLTLQALVLVVGIPLGLLSLALISPRQLDELPGLCLWKRLSGSPCPACGTTHALCHLVHGEPTQALASNLNVIVLAPLLLWLWATHLWYLLRGRPHPHSPPIP